MMARRLVAALALLVLMTGAAWAEPVPSPPPAALAAPAPSPEAFRAPRGTGAPRPEYRVGPSDELSVTMESFPDTEHVVRVREDGGFFLPMVGEIRAAGRTLPALRREIEQRLSRTLRRPGAVVGLRTPAVQYALVLGEVARPGQVSIPRGATVPQVLALAGGLTANADDTQGILIRDNQPKEIPLEPVASGFLAVGPNDILYVKAAQRHGVSVAGAVMAPGVHTLRQRATLWDAVVAAGGPRPEAALERVEVSRGSDPAPRVVDLSKGPTAPDAGLVLDQGDMVLVRERRVLVVGASGSASAVPLRGHESMLEVLAAAGVKDRRQLSHVGVVRGEDLRTGRARLESVDILKALSGRDPRPLPPVCDGDVLLLNPPREPLKLTDMLGILGIVRMFFH